jgi:hypothetical protein
LTGLSKLKATNARSRIPLYNQGRNARAGMASSGGGQWKISWGSWEIGECSF